jgi:hypothetical protein
LFRVIDELAEEAVPKTLSFFRSRSVTPGDSAVVFPRAAIPAADAFKFTGTQSLIPHGKAAAGWTNVGASPAGKTALGHLHPIIIVEML